MDQPGPPRSREKELEAARAGAHRSFQEVPGVARSSPRAARSLQKLSGAGRSWRSRFRVGVPPRPWVAFGQPHKFAHRSALDEERLWAKGFLFFLKMYFQNRYTQANRNAQGLDPTAEGRSLGPQEAGLGGVRPDCRVLARRGSVKNTHPPMYPKTI